MFIYNGAVEDTAELLKLCSPSAVVFEIENHWIIKLRTINLLCLCSPSLLLLAVSASTSGIIAVMGVEPSVVAA